MRKIIIFLAVVSSIMAQGVQTGLNITGAPGAYSINTADNYSWQTRTRVFKFKYTKVEEITHILKECLSRYGKIQINDQMNMVVITEEANKLENIIELCMSLDVVDMKEFVKLKTETIDLNYTTPSKIKDYLYSYLSIDGSVQAYDDLNLLIIHDHDDVVERVKQEIKKFDIAPQEIRLNFDVVEVINSDYKDNGINWDELFNVVNANAGWNFSQGSSNSDKSNKSSSSSTGGLGSLEGSNSSTSSESNKGGNGSWAFNGGLSISASNFKDFMRFMIEDGSANFVSNNSLSVLNNHSSVFYYNYQGSSVKVDITPNLLNSTTVKIDIELSVNNQVIFASTIHEKLGEVKRIVSFQNTNATINNKKLPVLGTVLPFMFSRKEKSKSDVKLDIVLTAYAVGSEMDIAKSTTTEVKKIEPELSDSVAVDVSDDK